MHIGQARLVIAGVIIVALVGWAVLDRNRQSAEIDRLTTKLEVIRGDASAEIAQLEASNLELDEALEVITAERDRLAAALSQSEERLGTTETQLEEATRELQQARALLAELDALVGPDGEIVRMPDLLGATVAEASEFAESVGAVLVVTTAEPTNVIARPDTIIAQLPEAETALVPGSVISVEVFVQPGVPGA
jgi:hypothetical protein